MSAAARRGILWAVVGVCGAAVVSLALVAALGSTTTVDRWETAGGAVAALIAALAALVPLLRPAPAPAPPSPGATVVRGRGNQVAAADAHHNATGSRAKVTHRETPAAAPPGAPAPGAPPVPPASGPDGAAPLEVRGNDNRVAGPGAHHNAIGDDSEIDHS
jgi:hypothetical protein